MRWVALAFLLAGCNAAQRCEEELCESAFTLTITPEGASSFAPGTYTFEVTFDGEAADGSCVVGDAPSEVSRCSGQGRVNVVLDDFAVVAFTVKTPAAKRIIVTVRAQCPTRALVAQLFEPTYDPKSCGCRGESATTVAKHGGALTMCPDAGTD